MVALLANARGFGSRRYSNPVESYTLSNKKREEKREKQNKIYNEAWGGVRSPFEQIVQLQTRQPGKESRRDGDKKAGTLI